MYVFSHTLSVSVPLDGSDVKRLVVDLPQPVHVHARQRWPLAASLSCFSTVSSTMSNDIELEDLRKAREEEPGSERPKHGRINLDANQEQTIAYWAYGATVLYVLQPDRSRSV